MAHEPKSSLSVWWQGALFVIGVTIATFLFLFICALMLGDPVRDTLLSAHGVLHSGAKMELSAQEVFLLRQMLESGAILTPAELLSEISAFYERVITILTALIAVLGFIAYMYIKSVSAESATRIVKEAVREHIDSTAHKDFVGSEVGRVTKPQIEGLQSFQTDIQERLDNVDRLISEESMISKQDLFSRITKIEEHLALQDDEESAGSDDTLD